MESGTDTVSDGTGLRNRESIAVQSISTSGGPHLPSQASGDTKITVTRKDNKKAWLVCFAAFLIQVIVVGNLHVFGIYFISFLDEFKATKATTGS